MYEVYLTVLLDCVVWKRVLTVTATDTEVLFCSPEPVCFSTATKREHLRKL